MPTFRYSQSVAAGATFDPLVNWQYRYLPWPGNVVVLAQATAVGVVNTLTSGSETIVEESPTQAGGTAGVTPSQLNTPADIWQAAAGDLLKLLYRNTSGAAVTVDGVIEVEPIGY